MLSPEAKYQELKQQWYFHPSSWYKRKKGEGSYDGKGCNQFTGCIPECKFYLEKGKLAENEGFDQPYYLITLFVFFAIEI